MNKYVMPPDDLNQAMFLETASGPWSVTRVAKAQTASRSPQGYLRPFGIGLVFALSPLTSVVDPWLLERRRQSQPTTVIFVDAEGRRRVSLREARQIALRFMANMESARLRAAEDEARRLISLEEME